MWIEGAEKLLKTQSFNHYCAKHHEWWNTSNAKDCPICIKERKKKNVLHKRSKK